MKKESSVKPPARTEKTGKNLLYSALFFFIVILPAITAFARPIIRQVVRQPPPQNEPAEEVKQLIPEPPVPNTSMGSIILESLEAEFNQNQKLVHVKGKLTNISKSFIRGHLTIYILSAYGVSLFSTDIPLNNHNPFGDGESVSFDTSLNVSSAKGAAKVSLDFTRD